MRIKEWRREEWGENEKRSERKNERNWDDKKDCRERRGVSKMRERR